MGKFFSGEEKAGSIAPGPVYRSVFRFQGSVPLPNIICGVDGINDPGISGQALEVIRYHSDLVPDGVECLGGRIQALLFLRRHLEVEA